jgi:hypothetical protein
MRNGFSVRQSGLSTDPVCDRAGNVSRDVLGCFEDRREYRPYLLDVDSELLIVRLSVSGRHTVGSRPARTPPRVVVL